MNNRDRLIKLFRVLGSDNRRERDNAFNLIDEMLRKRRATWSDLPRLLGLGSSTSRQRAFLKCSCLRISTERRPVHGEPIQKFGRPGFRSFRRRQMFVGQCEGEGVESPRPRPRLRISEDFLDFGVNCGHRLKERANHFLTPCPATERLQPRAPGDAGEVSRS